MQYNTLCLSGGGIMGLAHIGCLEYLEINKIINLKNINTYIGTSAGSIICFFISIGYSIQEIKKFIYEFNFEILVPDINIDDLFNNYGIDDGNKIKYIFIMFLKNKFNLSDINFIDLYKLTNNKLSIIGTNYTLKKEELFNYIKTPEMSVIAALRISMSVPLLFTPYIYNNMYYIDGALFNNFPIKYCNIETTLGININIIELNKTNKLNNLFEYILACSKLLLNNFLIYNNNLSHNIIIINCNNTVNMSDFNIINLEKNNIINNGFEAGLDYINNLKNNICLSIINDIIESIAY